jgi:hypothetical protein
MLLTIQIISAAGLENLDYGRGGTAELTTQHPSLRKSWH